MRLFQMFSSLSMGRISLLGPALLLISFSRCDEKPGEPAPPAAPDTTTQDWRFEIDTLGDRNSYVQKIVAFSPDDAWAAGTFLEYTNPNDPWDSKKYNVAHWNGKEWTYFQACSPLFEGYGLFGLRSNYVVLAAYGLCIWEGSSWRSVSIPEHTFDGLYGIWAKDQHEFHIVGHKGTWTKWDGQIPLGHFTKVPTSTTVDLTDIYGDDDVIYACGHTDPGILTVLLKYQNGKTEIIDSLYHTRLLTLSSVWYSKREDVIALAGVRQRIWHNGWFEADTNGSTVPRCNMVRGTAFNNIWWAGDFSFLMHFNGKSWRHFREAGQSTRIYYGLSVGNDYMFAAGVAFAKDGWPRGIVVRGYRIGE